MKKEKLKKFLRKYGLLVFLAFVATILGFWKFTLASLPKVTSVSPSPGKVEKLPYRVTIEFAKPVSSSQRKEVFLRTSPFLSPSLFWEKTGQTLFVEFPQGSLAGKKELHLELFYQKTLLFTGEYQKQREEEKPTPFLRQEKGNPNAQEEIGQKVITQYPLIKYLPYETSLFYVNYLGPKKLGVKLKGENKTAAKFAFFEWLKEEKIELGDHEIVWLEGN